jgi:hypothetical protein
VDTYWTSVESGLYLIVKHEIVLSIVATHTNYTALVNTQQPTTHTHLILLGDCNDLGARVDDISGENG